MIKRMTWFLGGAVAGLTGMRYGKRKVKQTAAQLAPGNVARVAASKARERGRDVVDAMRDGREAMRAKEAELRATLADDAAASTKPRTMSVVIGQPAVPEADADPDADAVIAGDQLVESALCPTREGRDRDEHVGPRRTSRRSRR